MTIDPVSLAITAGLTALQMGVQAMKRIEGPRLTDLQVTVADYGTPLNYFKGLRRFEGAPLFWAEPLREVKRTRKTKGGKFNEYTYYGTFAAMVADHEIDAVTRIWLDKHLAYDATSPGPVTPFALSDGGQITDYIRIYLGTETQDADPTMLASVEAKEGTGSCPAYRGVAYVMFDGLPLEKFGNRVPQITIEAITNGQPDYPWEVKDSPIGKPYTGAGFSFSPDFSRFVYLSGTDYAIWDTASRSLMLTGELSAPDETPSGGSAGIANDGRIYFPNGTSVHVYSPDGLVFDGTIDVPARICSVKQVDNGDEFLCCYRNVTDTTIAYVNIDAGLGSPIEIDSADIVAGGFTVTQFLVDAYGSLWAVGAYQAAFSGGVKPIYFYRVHDSGGNPGSPGFGQVDGFTLASLPTVHAAHVEGQFVIEFGSGTIYAIDELTFAVLDSDSFSSFSGAQDLQWELMPPGRRLVWAGPHQYDLLTLEEVQTLTTSNWSGSNWSGLQVYDPINNAIITTPGVLGADVLYWNYLDRVTAGGVTLADIVEDVAGRCAIDPADFDASALTQEIDGYSWTQGDGKSIIEPLLSAYDSVIRPHNFQLEFRKLGDTPSATLETEWFVREGDDPRYKVTITQDTDLPASVSFNFADLDKDQQTNSVVAQRNGSAIDSTRETTIDMTTLAIDADDARSLADRYFRRAWFARTGVENALTRKELALEPSDVRYLELDGITAGYRLLRLEYGANGVLSCRWVRDDPSLAEVSGSQGAQMAGRNASIILVPLPSKAFVLDIPLLRDSDAAVTPGLYHAAAPYSDGAWPGETLYQSLDGGLEYSTAKATVSSSSPSAWGIATDTLDDANPNLWDRGNSVNVRMQFGTLTSASEATIDGGPNLNLALLGDELFQFATATLEVDGTYTLTGLKRGRRGTEWATGDHASGEVFVLLDQAVAFAMGASDVDTDLYFKGVTDGRDATSAFPVNLHFTGASLMPYAPTSIEAIKDAGTGDWSIDWIRRTRVGGAWTGGSTIPLSETSEEYDIEILDGLGAVVRTYSGLTSPTVVYDAADQASDGGDVAEGDLHLRVYQLSDTVGRGFAALADF